MTRTEAMQKTKVHYIPLPEGIHGAVKPTAEGYIIAINSALSEQERARTLEHELMHIMRNHFSDERPIREIEAEAENMTYNAVKNT